MILGPSNLYMYHIFYIIELTTSVSPKRPDQQIKA